MASFTNIDKNKVSRTPFSFRNIHELIDDDSSKENFVIISKSCMQLLSKSRSMRSKLERYTRMRGEFEAHIGQHRKYSIEDETTRQRIY